MMRRLIYIWAAVSAVIIFGAAIVFAVMWSRGLGARSHPSEMESNVAMSVWESSIPSRSSRMKSPLTQVDLRDAAGHYEEHCAVCHGDDGPDTRSSKARWTRLLPISVQKRRRRCPTGSFIG